MSFCYDEKVAKIKRNGEGNEATFRWMSLDCQSSVFFSLS